MNREKTVFLGMNGWVKVCGRAGSPVFPWKKIGNPHLTNPFHHAIIITENNKGEKNNES